MERRKKIIVAVIALGVVLFVGTMVLRSQSQPKLSGTYVAEGRTYSLPDEFVFDNGYCDIGAFTCTYEYKSGTLYFYWVSAVWEKYKCSINGNKIVINDDGKSVVYYKQ
mgnify:FL=1